MQAEVTKFVMLIICICICICIWSVAEANTRSSCQNKCGNVSIPYPFGIGDGCSISDPNFVITCHSSYHSPNPKPFLGSSKMEVLDVSLNGHLRILPHVNFGCFGSGHSNSLFSQPKFQISNTRNKFTVIGCEIWAAIRYTNQYAYASGCVSFCANSDFINGSCTGIGCCQTSIPSGMRDFHIKMASLDYNGTLRHQLCNYAFVAEDGAYTFSSSDLYNFSRKQHLPVTLDWTVGNQSCSEAKKDSENYACKENSVCIHSENGLGYLCKCRDGFGGNPYISNGCQDIDECKISNPCNGICEKLPGGYMCHCPNGYEGDGLKNGKGCIKNKQLTFLIVTVVSSALGLPSLLLAVWWVYKVLRRRKIMKLKQKFFKRNGGLLLLKRSLNEDEGEVRKTKLFTSKELEVATDKFSENRILGRGGQGLVYKGMLHDGKIVAVKKSKIVNQGLLEQFINEIVILSQIDHRNVVKLLGCCLETEVPLLVYEFVPNGSLHHLIHVPSEGYPRSWEIRLRIATEVASAISYLHSAASVPVYHRDIKSSNILLDEKLRARVSDFGISKSVGIEQTHLTTQVKGTFGYIDPEYFRSSQFTEKSDVYSFGVVLVELLTGRKPISLFGTNENKSLVANFISCLEEDHLIDILDVHVVKECGNYEELMRIAYLAKRCLSLASRNRPTMKEVAMELERIRMASLCYGGTHHDDRRQELEVDETAETSDQYDSDFTSTSTRSLLGLHGN